MLGYRHQNRLYQITSFYSQTAKPSEKITLTHDIINCAPMYFARTTLTVPVAVTSSPTQSTPSNVAFLTAQIAPMIALWSPEPSATKSGYFEPYHSVMYVDPT